MTGNCKLMPIFYYMIIIQLNEKNYNLEVNLREVQEVRHRIFLLIKSLNVIKIPYSEVNGNIPKFLCVYSVNIYI